MTKEKVTDCDGKGPPLFMDKNNDYEFPYWQTLHNRLTDDLKSEKYIKDIHKHPVHEINDMIKSGKMWCDDCGKPFELKLPKNYEELSDFSCHIINSSVVRPCDDCVRKDIENGRVIGSSGSGWYPNKEILLKELLGDKKND